MQLWNKDCSSLPLSRPPACPYCRPISKATPEMMIASASFGLKGSVSLALLIVLWTSHQLMVHSAPAKLSIRCTAIKVIWLLCVTTDLHTIIEPTSLMNIRGAVGVVVQVWAGPWGVACVCVHSCTSFSERANFRLIYTLWLNFVRSSLFWKTYFVTVSFRWSFWLSNNA